jgi:hypothetical protein
MELVIMKLNHLFLLGTTTLLVSVFPIASYGQSVANPSSNRMEIKVAKSQSVAAMSGTFVAAEKPTSGTARIVTEGGHRYLELDAAFSTSNQGPDLHVLLDTTNQPPKTYKNLGSAVNLGRLKSYTGAQRYPIPDAIDAANFKSVVIWCRMANATFGYAPLRATN